jgi:hypothetical protein
VRRFRRVSGWNKAVHTTAANNGLGAKVSCVRCAREVSGLLLEASGSEYRCATPRRAQTLARNSSTRGGDADTHANANESADNSLRLPLHLFLLPFFSVHLHGRRPARDGDRRQRALAQRPCALLSTRQPHSTTRTDRQTDRQTDRLQSPAATRAYPAITTHHHGLLQVHQDHHSPGHRHPLLPPRTLRRICSPLPSSGRRCLPHAQRCPLPLRWSLGRQDLRLQDKLQVIHIRMAARRDTGCAGQRCLPCGAMREHLP